MCWFVSSLRLSEVKLQSRPVWMDGVNQLQLKHTHIYLVAVICFNDRGGRSQRIRMRTLRLPKAAGQTQEIRFPRGDIKCIMQQDRQCHSQVAFRKCWVDRVGDFWHKEKRSEHCLVPVRPNSNTDIENTFLFTTWFEARFSNCIFYETHSDEIQN